MSANVFSIIMRSMFQQEPAQHTYKAAGVISKDSIGKGSITFPSVFTAVACRYPGTLLSAAVRLRRIMFAALLCCCFAPAIAQGKSPAYSASGAFATDVDSALNPGSFQNVRFDTLFAFTGVNSRYLDLGVAAKFGKVYTALSYSGNVFDFTGFNLMAITAIKPKRLHIRPNTEPGNLQHPDFSNKVSLLIGGTGLPSAYFKNIGFKLTLEMLSARHTKDELYGSNTLTVVPTAAVNPVNPARFQFKNAEGKRIGAGGTDRAAVRFTFDWSGFRFPIGKRTLTVKPFFGVDINRSITEAVTDIPAKPAGGGAAARAQSHTEGIWRNGTTDVKAFLNAGYGEFSLNYYFSYKFFPDIAQVYRYSSRLVNAGSERLITVNQTYDQTGRRDMINKVTAGYKPSFKLADSTVLLTPGLQLAVEFRSLITPHTLITTQTTDIQTGSAPKVVKSYIKEYTPKISEQRIIISPIASLGVQYRILPEKLYLNAGFNVQMDYNRTVKAVTAPSVGKAWKTLAADPSGEKEGAPKTERSKVQNSHTATHAFKPKGTFGVGFQWLITSAVTFDTAFTVITDFKHGAYTRENLNLAAALSVKL